MNLDEPAGEIQVRSLERNQWDPIHVWQVIQRKVRIHHPTYRKTLFNIMAKIRARIEDAKLSPYDRMFNALPPKPYQENAIVKIAEDKTREALTPSDVYHFVTENWTLTEWTPLYVAEDARYPAVRKWLDETLKKRREEYGEHYNRDIREAEDFIIGVEHAAQRIVAFTLGRFLGR